MLLALVCQGALAVCAATASRWAEAQRDSPRSEMGTFVFAVALAFVLGFAAHRASICTVRAVAEVMSARSGSIFLSIGKSILWVWALVIPVLAFMPAAGIGLAGWSLTGTAVLGGFLFGMGAAMNGGCAYSTMARFVDGDGKMLATIIGFAVGVFCFATLAKWRWLTQPAPAPALVGSLFAGSWARVWAGALACAFVAWSLYEILRLWRTRPGDKRFIELILAPRYRLSTAAALVGLPGALLFLIYGPISYTATFELIIQGALGTQGWPSAMRTILLLAVMAGMLTSTLQRGTFRFDWRPRFSWLLNLSAGAFMGLGTALAPGGNDALLLYGIPILSPYAAPTFTALTLGVALGLVAMRRWFGIEARVKCQNDIFINDSWSRPISLGEAPPRHMAPP
ncbi:MAG: uncharacterized protein QOJ15_3048 [Bradyrhizobium sp.]|nr:uncharacterized protein [Bradyrhizobium sp.]